MKFKQNASMYIRNFIFGVEDSLVSTVGLLSGIAITNMSGSKIITTGIILIFVEAFSMSIGSLLSEHSVEEYENHKNVSFWNAALGALTMFFAYFIFGFAPLLPYVFAPLNYAFWISIIFSLIVLFLVGSLSSKFLGARALRNGFEMLGLGGVAIVVGVIIGRLANSVF